MADHGAAENQQRQYEVEQKRACGLTVEDVGDGR
jgi:hypothetical protein